MAHTMLVFIQGSKHDYIYTKNTECIYRSTFFIHSICEGAERDHLQQRRGGPTEQQSLSSTLHHTSPIQIPVVTHHETVDAGLVTGQPM